MTVPISASPDLAEQIVWIIDESYSQAARNRQGKSRMYIGASGIGHPCDAALAFSLRGFPDSDIEPRLQRIFNLGHVIEEIVEQDLKCIEQVLNCEVQPLNPLTGQQFSYQQYGGHVKAHTDGQILFPDYVLVLEIKSMNNDKWKAFHRQGIRRSHRNYFDQVQMYMGLSGLRQTLFIAYNKDKSLYHAEVIDYDELEFAWLQERIRRAMANEAEKVATDRSDWRCKGCFKKEVCWQGVQADKTCVSCHFARANINGGWDCTLNNREAVQVCSEYQQYQPLSRSQ